MKDLVKTRVLYILRKHFLMRINPALYHKLSHLGLNATEQAEFAWYLENEFAISLEDREVLAIRTIGDSISLVTSHLQKAYSLVV